MDSRVRILVVEDDQHVAGALVAALDAHGYQTREVPDGRAGLAVLRQWHPDLILLDLHLPGMSGREFRDRQRRKPEIADIPVVVMSADHDATPDRLEHLGAVAVIRKPFTLDVLLATVGQFAGLHHRSHQVGSSLDSSSGPNAAPSGDAESPGDR